MTKATSNQTILQVLEDRIATGQTTQGKVAKALGLNSSTIGAIRKGKYAADPSGILAKVASHLAAEKQRAADPGLKIEYTPTRNARRIMELVELCHIECEMGVLTGQAGAGKTTVLKEYARQHPEALLVEADFSMTARVLFQRLSDLLDLPTKGSLQVLLDNVIAKLAGSGRIIMIDEAEHLNYRSLEQIRRVHDKASVGILLAGMPKLYHTLRGDKGDFAQLYSRVGAVVQLREGLTEEDALKLCEAAGIRGDVKPFVDACGGNGRKLAKLLRRASRIARLNQTDLLNPDVVKAAAEMLMF